MILYGKLAAKFFAIVALCTAMAVGQTTGTHATGTATKDDKGDKAIQTKTPANDTKIKEVRIWEPMSETWIKINPTSIVPNPGKDPKITLPDPLREGDKFEIDWETTTNQPGISSSTFEAS